MAKAATPKATPPVLCAFCGKTIKAGATHGALCAKNAKAGYTPAKALVLKQAFCVNTLPTGYITMAQAHKACNQYNTPVSRLVHHTGGDGVKYPPSTAITTPVFYNGTRYLPAVFGTKAGVQCLFTGNFSSLPPATPAQIAWYNYVIACQQAVLAGKPLPKQPQGV